MVARMRLTYPLVWSLLALTFTTVKALPILELSVADEVSTRESDSCDFWDVICLAGDGGAFSCSPPCATGFTCFGGFCINAEDKISPTVPGVGSLPPAPSPEGESLGTCRGSPNYCLWLWNRLHQDLYNGTFDSGIRNLSPSAQVQVATNHLDELKEECTRSGVCVSVEGFGDQPPSCEYAKDNENDYMTCEDASEEECDTWICNRVNGRCTGRPGICSAIKAEMMWFAPTQTKVGELWLPWIVSKVWANSRSASESWLVNLCQSDKGTPSRGLSVSCFRGCDYQGSGYSPRPGVCDSISDKNECDLADCVWFTASPTGSEEPAYLLGGANDEIPDDDGTGSSGTSTAVVIAGVVGGIAGMAFIAGAFVAGYYLRKKRRLRKAVAASNMDATAMDLEKVHTSPLGSSSEKAAALFHPSSQSQKVLSDVRPWELQHTDIDKSKSRVIGAGSFGNVIMAKYHETLVAVKYLMQGSHQFDEENQQHSAIKTLSNPRVMSLREECLLLASLRHPNIVTFMGYCVEPPCLVTEYCTRGSLYDRLAEARGGGAAASQLTWERRLNIALDAAKGMLYLHTRDTPIVHRDLKSPNLLVDYAWRTKVTDFNLSKMTDIDGIVSVGGAPDNPRWLAPEVLNGKGATLSSDVFSFGVVLWELLTWQSPWELESRDRWVVCRKILDGERLAFPSVEELPPTGQGLDDYIALVKKCWLDEPTARPSFAQIVPELRELTMAALKVRGHQGGKDGASS